MKCSPAANPVWTVNLEFKSVQNGAINYFSRLNNEPFLLGGFDLKIKGKGELPKKAPPE